MTDKAGVDQEAIEPKPRPQRDARGRFVRGNSGNPRGRPPAAFSPTELLRAGLAERPRLVKRLLDLCESEDAHVAVRALAYVIDRLDGRARQSHEVSGPGGQAVRLVWSDGREVEE